MELILVPTDFSTLAGYAEEAAIQMATWSRCNILFYHCSPDLPAGWEHIPPREKDKHPDQLKVRDELLAIMSRLKEQCDAVNVTCQTIIGTGRFLDSVEDLVQKEKIDLIVMGSHGASGKQEYFIGSNTQKVIRKVHTNLLIVKDPLQTIRFRKIIFATNLGVTDQEAFADFLSMIQIFRPEEIHLLTIDTPGFITRPAILVEERQKDFQRIASDYHCTTHFIRNFTVEAGIRKFSETIGANLIAISNYERHPIKRIFTGSNVEMLANHSSIPVLSLDKARITTM